MSDSSLSALKSTKKQKETLYISNIEEICSTFNVNDVILKYEDYQQFSTDDYEQFSHHFYPVLKNSNPKAPESSLKVLLAAKWLEFVCMNEDEVPNCSPKSSVDKNDAIFKDDDNDRSYVDDSNSSEVTINYETTNLPSSKDVCSWFGLQDVELCYNKTHFKIVNSATAFIDIFNPLLSYVNPHEPKHTIRMLLLAKYREFCILKEEDDARSDIRSPAVKEEEDRFSERSDINIEEEWELALRQHQLPDASSNLQISARDKKSVKKLSLMVQENPDIVSLLTLIYEECRKLRKLNELIVVCSSYEKKERYVIREKRNLNFESRKEEDLFFRTYKRLQNTHNRLRNPRNKLCHKFTTSRKVPIAIKQNEII